MVRTFRKLYAAVLCLVSIAGAITYYRYPPDTATIVMVLSAFYWFLWFLYLFDKRVV